MMTRQGSWLPGRLVRYLICTSALSGLMTALPAAAQSAAAVPETSATGPAAPQPSADAEGSVGEVVVTARQRREDIEKVPAQVTAFTAAGIEAKGVNTPADFLDAVPNVTFVPTQNAGTAFIVIRGISQARNSEPSVSVIVDGVPITQPAEINQALVDIQQIEVLKGPQGALYGRNAIGGAILITTQQPTDQWKGQVTAGYENGPGSKLEGIVSGPVTDTLKIRAAVNDVSTDGVLHNQDTQDVSSSRHADPLRDLSARVSAIYQPIKAFTADLRLSTDLLNTRGLYYTIPTFGTPGFNDPNYTKQPIDLNNSGKDDRKIYDAALKLNYNADYGTFTSITGYSTVWEILTGDGYPFDPFGKTQTNFDYAQTQFLNAKTFSQELRFTSPTTGRFHWIAGAEIFSTDRFISTGNEYDFGTIGVQPVYRTPRAQLYEAQGQLSYLADSQNQFAWATYFDTSTDLTKDLELSVNLRVDSDHREDTTDTPQSFLNAAGIPGATGQQRSHTWSAFEPQVVLKYAWFDNLSLYTSYGRGFRSGGFNQTGVAQAAKAAGFDNVGDMFNAEIADTFEVGFKSRWLDNRLTLNGSVYTTNDHGDYYFVFLASNSTQNLGNIREAELTGVDLDGAFRITSDLIANVGFGYTDSRITKFPGASSGLVVGSKVPLVSDYTLNAGVQYTHKIGHGWDWVLRLDDNLIGPTPFVIPVPAAGEPNVDARNPVNLFDLRTSVQSDVWTLSFWSKNMFDTHYEAEYSTGGFHFPAQPRTYGVDLTRRF